MEDKKVETFLGRCERVAPTRTWQMSALGVVVGAAVLGVVVAAAIALAPIKLAAAPADLGPGCAPDRSAIRQLVSSLSGRSHPPGKRRGGRLSRGRSLREPVVFDPLR